MVMVDEKALMERIIRARKEILLRYPFYGHLLMGMPIALAACKTACTDGEKLIFDPQFVLGLTGEELQILMLHEVMHCVLGHCLRGKGKLQRLYNIACDIVVNSMILRELGKKEFPLAGAPMMHKTPKGEEGCLYSADEVYAMLAKGRLTKSSQEFWLTIETYAKFDRHDTWGAIANESRFEAQWKNRIKEAAKLAGQMPDHIPQDRYLMELQGYHSGVNWRRELLDFIDVDCFDYTFQPPDARYAQSDFLLPAYNKDSREGVADLWLLVDTSASVDTEQLSVLIQEIHAAMNQVGLVGKLSFFDQAVYEPVDFCTVTDLKKIKPIGGGGTDYHQIFEYMWEHMRAQLPKGILIFTDGFAKCPPESKAHGVPVLWIITKGGDTAKPWGKVIAL